MGLILSRYKNRIGGREYRLHKDGLYLPFDLQLFAGTVHYIRQGATGSGSGADGTNACTMLTATNFAGGPYGALGYKINCSAVNPSTLVFSLSGAATYRNFTIMQFRPDGGDTVTLDQGPSSNTGPNSGTFLSSAITTTGTDEVMIGALVQYSWGILSNLVIGGTAAGGMVGSPNSSSRNYNAMWYRIATGSGVTANGNSDTGDYYVCDICAFKSEAGAPGGTIIPIVKYYYTRRHE